MSVAFLIIDIALGMRLKLLAVVDVLAFGAFAVIAVVADEGSLTWLETWFGELANILLVLVVAGSMLVGVPFTIQYAKEQTDPEYWDTRPATPGRHVPGRGVGLSGPDRCRLVGARPGAQPGGHRSRRRRRGRLPGTAPFPMDRQIIDFG